MKQNVLRVEAVVLAMLLTLLVGRPACARGGVEVTGDVLTAALPAAASALIVASKDGEGAVQLAESAALTAGTTFILKYTVREERPNKEDRHSFPSLHSSASFASAEFIRKRYGWEYGIPAYAVASFVAYSRVEAKQHHSGDVVAGAAIGILSSYLFTRPYQGVQVRAEADHGYYGLRLTRAW
jgi:membrane-associated phospholipid phosphatase